VSRRALLSAAGVLAILGFVVYGAWAFRASMTPYVTFDQALSSSSAIQVAGRLKPGSHLMDEATGRLSFILLDEEGRRLEVHYRGRLPGNFHDADQLVAIGRVNDGILEAERLLAKCPSKYEAAQNGGSAAVLP
jgi:cytochrome c-type biogenesis protein CcmE